MRFIALTVALTASLVHLASANLDIHHVGIGGNGITGNGEGWQVYEAQANCDNAKDWYWLDTDDASGRGALCEGDGCGRGDDDSADDITVLEMNFTDGYHWTYYKSCNGDLVDTNDNPVGNCSPFPGPELNCGLTISRIEGYCKLRCIGDFIALDIDSHNN
ncbi:hypothetical protein DDE82_001753 [Stemphylium lycopersici]|uniref:Uncharacterized protein n=1 Tax=Stemphylium lycopersici TaxID=183478 RepID=A0A364MU28_STELY|nr:hypothetical protein TW65_08062 [Stemphylium lycopersici]RAR03507.1 hypothetical protein DDE83_008203 [Stemphylium lycopersici]RAR09244.1 hypothetical protein DDE82_001753 [Stemphylium lycopersici]